VNDRKYEELEAWEKAFVDLNAKIGNDAWGARLEGDGAKGYRLRIFVENKQIKDIVMVETMGIIREFPIVFTEYSQEAYTLRESINLEQEISVEKKTDNTK